jgi:phosphomannomutase
MLTHHAAATGGSAAAAALRRRAAPQHHRLLAAGRRQRPSARASFQSTPADEAATTAATPVVLTGLSPPMSPDDVRAAFARLQNGSDVRGVALQLAPDGPPVNLTPAVAFFLGRAFALALKRGDFFPDDAKKTRRPRVSVGTDPRLSAGILKAALAAGLMDGGADVEDCGLATTPACYYALRLPSATGAGSAGAAGATPTKKCAATLEKEEAEAEAAASADAEELSRRSPPLGAVMITASHMPAINNGFKFFVLPQGGLEKPQIGALLKSAAEEAAEALNGAPLGDPAADYGRVLERALQLPGLAHEGGAADGEEEDDNAAAASAASTRPRLTRRPLLEQYAAHLRRVIVRGAGHGPKPLQGMRVLVDAGNGSGGFFAARVLQPLGADTTGSQFLDPDGRFPNHAPNPEDARAMASASAACLANKADLGIVFDTDVDRAAIVDASGKSINSNRFIALMAAVALREKPGTTVVTDSVTSDGLAEFIAKRGGKHLRFKRGYRNVIGKGAELNAAGVDCALMMETSGHGALADNHFLDDGAHLAVKALIEAVRLRGSGGGGGVEALVADLREAREAGEFRLKIRVPEGSKEDFKAFGGRVLAAFHDWVVEGGKGAAAGAVAPPPGDWSLEPENHEGWRVRVGSAAGSGKPARGWLLLRQSLHDPLLVLNVESDDEGGVARDAARVKAWAEASGFGFAGAAGASSSGPQLDLSALG